MHIGRNQRVRILLAVALMSGTLALWWPATDNGFVNFDDPEYVTANPHVNKGFTLEGVRWAFGEFYSSNWHPLTMLSHMADSQLWGLDPRGHHATSVVLHALNTALLFAVLAALTGAVWRSAVVAALFAVHPLRVESVAWVAERKDVLSAFFWLIGIAAYARFVRHRSRIAYAGVVLALAAGLMAKPMLITFPLTLLLLDIWPLGRLHRGTVRRLLVEKLPFAGFVAVSGFVTVLAQRHGNSLETFERFPLGVRLMNGSISIVKYIGKMLWPADLSVLYPHPGAEVSVPGAVISALLIAGLSAVALAARRRPYLSVGWFWFLATLLPVLGLVQVGQQELADRYTYVPLIGVFVACIWYLADIFGRWHAAASLRGLAAVILIVCLGWATRGALVHWRDGATLFSRALVVTGGNATIRNNLGTALAQQGRLKEALPHLREAVRLDQGSGRYCFNLANVLAGLARDGEAEVQYRRAIALQEDSSEFRVNFAVLLVRTGRIEEAITTLGQAVLLNPQNDRAHYNLGLILRATGRTPEGEEHLRIAMQLNPLLGGPLRQAADALPVR